MSGATNRVKKTFPVWHLAGSRFLSDGTAVIANEDGYVTWVK